MDIKNFIIDLLFPKFCFNCRKEGSYFCDDCKALLEISGFHQTFSTENLKDLYFVAAYQNPLIEKLIQRFKYEPFVKELAEPLASLIVAHFQLFEKLPDFSEFLLIPTPLEKKKLKRRGFNQAEEIGREIASFLKIPLISNCLIKVKGTVPQVELSDQERKENIRNAFAVKNNELIKGRKILLVDDVYTTGSTMEECAKILRIGGAKEIIGVVIARG